VAALLELAQEAGARPGAPASPQAEEAMLRWVG
jgi:hypothetical protein